MDETMCSFVSAVIEKMRPHFPDKQLKLPAYGKYTRWFKDYFPGQDREVLAKHVFNDDFYLGLRPILNGFDGHTIEKLSRACWERFDRIKVLTFRDGMMQNPKEVTQEWLKRNGFVDSERVDVHVLKGSESKLSYVKRSTVFVDDSLTVADEVTASKEHHMILVSHPWNDGYARKANCTITPVRRMIERIGAARDML
jgi:hypothetical protein